MQLYLIANSFSKLNDYEVSFVVGNFGQKDVEEYDKVKVYKYPHEIKETIFIYHISDQKKLNKFLSGIDADIYVYRSGTKIAPLVSYYAKKNNKKFVYMLAYNINAEVAYSNFAKKFVNILYPLLGIYRYLYALSNADEIIVQNYYQKHLLEGNIKRKSHLIRSGYQIDEFNKKNAKYILYVSRCCDYKQPELFIELAKEFPLQKFVMICPGDGDYFDKIKSMAGDVPNLRFIKEVDLDAIDRYFRDAKLFVNTAVHEGFPNTYIQATKNMVPILTLYINPDEIFDKFKIGIVCGNMQALKQNLVLLLNNKELYFQMSENAYNYAKENHDLKKIVSSYDKIFKSLLKN